MTTQGYSFTLHGGEIAPKGKPHWPSFIRLSLSHKELLDTAHQLLTMYRNRSEEGYGDDCRVEIPLFGELIRQPDDDILHKT